MSYMWRLKCPGARTAAPAHAAASCTTRIINRATSCRAISATLIHSHTPHAHTNTYTFLTRCVTMSQHYLYKSYIRVSVSVAYVTFIWRFDIHWFLRTYWSIVWLRDLTFSYHWHNLKISHVTQEVVGLEVWRYCRDKIKILYWRIKYWISL